MKQKININLKKRAKLGKGLSSKEYSNLLKKSSIEAFNAQFTTTDLGTGYSVINPKINSER